MISFPVRHIQKGNSHGRSVLLPDHPPLAGEQSRYHPALFLPTPNGVKISIALEELELPYEAHLVSFGTNDQKTPEFLSLNPNGRIPAMIDPDGPDGKPIGLFESGAMLVYLAEKTGKLMPTDAAGRYDVLQWVFFQMGGIGPMFGQFGHFFKYAADKVANNSYPVERYRDETKRLLGFWKNA